MHIIPTISRVYSTNLKSSVILFHGIHVERTKGKQNIILYFNTRVGIIRFTCIHSNECLRVSVVCAL